MDRYVSPGHGDRWATTRLNPGLDGLRGVCLERTLELESVTLQVRDWPGLGGPLVHVPDPHGSSSLIEALAASLVPRYRVLSVLPRTGCPYQVHVTDLLAGLAQFGFRHAVVVAEGLGSVTALILAAWHPERVGALALVDPRYEGPCRSLRDCPPDWTLIRGEITAPVLELASTSPTLVTDVERLLGSRVP